MEAIPRCALVTAEQIGGGPAEGEGLHRLTAVHEIGGIGDDGWPVAVKDTVSERGCEHRTDELVTLREIGAAWLAADAGEIAQALQENALQEVDDDDSNAT
ncbi:hypothetical protein WCLP8_1710001 [uncultured Gammaproteobacteria bacterium]